MLEAAERWAAVDADESLEKRGPVVLHRENVLELSPKHLSESEPHPSLLDRAAVDVNVGRHEAHAEV
jgi:hypothetical protein